MIKVCVRCGKGYFCLPGSDAEKDELCGTCFRPEDSPAKTTRTRTRLPSVIPDMTEIKSSLESLVDKNRIGLREEEISKSVLVVLQTQGSKKRRDRIRRRASIYRLYRYFGLTPMEVSILCGIRQASVRIIVGQVFKELCLKETHCVFKEYLKPSPDIVENIDFNKNKQTKRKKGVLAFS